MIVSKSYASSFVLIRYGATFMAMGNLKIVTTPFIQNALSSLIRDAAWIR